MIHLEEITEANFTEALRLEVGEDQRRFVAPAAGILARGYVYRSNRARVYAIMAEDVMVGLALVRDLDEPPACYDLQQFMIDRRHQGRGYGGEALRQLLALLRAKAATMRWRFACTGRIWRPGVFMSGRALRTRAMWIPARRSA